MKKALGQYIKVYCMVVVTRDINWLNSMTQEILVPFFRFNNISTNINVIVTVRRITSV